GWQAGEPNNFRGGEHFAATNYNGVLGEWNDFAGNTPFVKSWLVEFGGMPGETTGAVNASGRLRAIEAVAVAPAPPVAEPEVRSEPADDGICRPEGWTEGCWSVGAGVLVSTLQPDDTRSGWKLV